MTKLSWTAIVAALLAVAAIVAAIFLPEEEGHLVVALAAGSITAAVLALRD